MAANFSPTLAVSRAGQASHEADESVFGLSEPAGRAGWLTLVLLVVGLTAAYWRVLVHTSEAWTQPQYSHGWIVPLIGLYLLWNRRPDSAERSELSPLLGGAAGCGALMAAAGFFMQIDWLQGVGLAVSVIGITAVGLLNQPFSPLTNHWRIDASDSGERVLLGGAIAGSLMAATTFAGILPPGPNVLVMVGALCAYGATLLGVALASRPGPLMRTGSETITATAALVGTSLIWIQASQLDLMPVMRLSFLVSLIGAFGIVGGRRLLRWAGPAVAFIIFMFPLPSVIENSLLRFLQKLAAVASETVLQVTGMPVYRLGNQLVIEGLSKKVELEVAEACSGLRMGTIFVAMTVAMVFLIQRPWWDKFTILLSAIPVALLVNVMRIVATAMLFYAFPDNEDMKTLVHDYAGFAMMPVAMGILWLELTILSNLTIEDDGVDYQTSGGVMPRI